MIGGELFDKLAKIAKQIRGNNLAFGGIQASARKARLRTYSHQGINHFRINAEHQ